MMTDEKKLQHKLVALERELIAHNYVVIKNIYGESHDLQYKDVRYCKCGFLLGTVDLDALMHIWKSHEIRPKALQLRIRTTLEKAKLIEEVIA
jgi:hypothetical protein